MKTRRAIIYLALIACTAAVVARTLLPGSVTAGLFTSQPEHEIVQRQPSPDGQLEVVQAMPATGATDGFVTWLFIVRSGVAPDGQPVLIADHVDGAINLIWSGDTEVTVRAKSARIFEKRSATLDLPTGPRTVTLKLDIAYSLAQ